jgi:glucokinase
MILAGDLGGTKSNLGLFDVQQGKLVRVAEKRFSSQAYPNAEQIMQEFLQSTAGGEQYCQSHKSSVDC